MNLKTVLKVKAGSTLYNLRTADSDEDIRGCVVPLDLPYLVGIKHFEQSETKNPDSVVWNLPKFLNLAFGGNTQILECLAAPDEFVVESDAFGAFMRKNFDKFLGKHIYCVLKGYSYGEYRRTVGATTGKLGDARKAVLEKYGYSIKNASHCIRLLLVGINIFSKGVYKTTFKTGEEDHQLLLDIKQGLVTKERFDSLYTWLTEEMTAAFNTTSLPAHADQEFFTSVATVYLATIISENQ